MPYPKAMAGRLPATACLSRLALTALLLLILIAAGRPPITRPNGPPQKAHAEVDGLALTPPMGWYPWNNFGQEPQNEKLIKEIADALVASGLKDAGYAYVGPDEGICFSRVPGR